MATVAVYSLKGGVGKTTLAVNLAWCGAIGSARRTLLWDLDPQAASTFLLAGDATGRRDQAGAVFTRDVAPAKQIRSTAIERLDLIAADRSLRELDIIFRDLAKKRRLQKLLQEAGEGYDRVLLDCPPGLSETADQVVRGADLIVVPVIPSPLSTRAFEEMIAHFGAKARVLPVHMMADRRRKIHLDAIAAHPDWPIIPMVSTIEAMTARRAPVGAFAPRSAAAASFTALWQAIERALVAAAA